MDIEVNRVLLKIEVITNENTVNDMDLLMGIKMIDLLRGMKGDRNGVKFDSGHYFVVMKEISNN